ncbi:solute carrier family 22 member 16 isoform X3 [Hemicordylus capensis]|uniref:solute carrier family 22 member 16 isoform X3 n=1 Tax=Hemicordylus capensis TaxID=884348 RepID=UPI0023049F58|nr:solute carrier family 22 member 16 isoform X3 [Hemicordylus capensis]
MQTPTLLSWVEAMSINDAGFLFLTLNLTTTGLTSGRMGYQAWVYFASVFQSISCGIHYLASVFLAVTPKFVCRVSGNVSSVLIDNSSSSSIEDAWTLWTSTQNYILVQLEDGDVWELNQCSRFRREDALNFTYEYSGNKTEFSCTDGFIYDRTKWQSTIVTEWDLVCQRAWLAKLTQPTFMLGVLLGAVIFGDIADRMGRRLVLWFTSIGQFIFGVAVAFTFNYYSFVIVRFLLAMVSSGYLVVVFVYVTEYIGIKARTWASMHVHAFFAVGIMVVALVGYLAETWWVYQICLSITTLPFVLCCWMLPETPFWLLTEGRYEEAQKVINVMARWNNVSTPCKISELCSVQDDLVNSRSGDNDHSSMKKHSILDLFRNWRIARRTITVWLVWFTGSLGYYVFSLSSVNLGGNEYLNLFLIGAVELPAYVFACIGMEKLGRRNTLIPFLLLSAVICALVMLIPQVPCCWKREHDVPGRECGGTFLCLSVKCLDLHASIDCWNRGLSEWDINADAARNPWETIDKYLGRSCRTR